jgi:phosphoribosyl-AMP cyclohydrolase
MGTRSRVGIMHGDVVKSVYCHYDGYLSCTGQILQQHYDSVKTNALVRRGDNSGIHEEIEDINFYNEHDEDKELAWQVAHSLEELIEQTHNCGGEYYYVMKDGVWYAGAVYATTGLIKEQLVPLVDALADILIEEALAEDN